MKQVAEKKYNVVHIAVIVFAILLTYAKVFGAGFMSWDDIDYVFNTPDIRAINSETISNWWSSYYIGNYQPLPVFTYAIDYIIGGEEPFIYHLQSILWHMADAILLYLLIKKLNGNALVALFVALLFALHPVQTESVSWIAARNKVMNAFFFFSAMYVYIDYVKTLKKKKLIWIYLLALAAYLCKLTAVTLPFALLAIDVWMNRSLKDNRVWLEKLPLIVLAIPIGIITLQAQEEVSFLNLHPEFTFLHTILFAGYAYVQYIVNLLFPYKLSVLYPYPTELSWVHYLYTLISITIVISGFFAYRKKQFLYAGGVLFYTVNIAIVLQFVQFGEVLMADRYLYIACVGVWYPLVCYSYHFIAARQTNIAGKISLSVLVVAFTIITFIRNDIWLSELNFWKSVTDKFPESSVAQTSLGAIYMEEGNTSLAATHINEAVRIDANNPKAWYNKGVLHLRQGDMQNALSSFNKTLSLAEYPKALFSRALVYQQMGNCQRAMSDISVVLRNEPENARAHFIKADCLEQSGNIPEALVEYNKAVSFDADEPMYYLRRGLAFAKKGNANYALLDMDKAIEQNPKYAEAYYWRGMIKYRNGQNPCADIDRAYKEGLAEARQAMDEICK